MNTEVIEQAPIPDAPKPKRRSRAQESREHEPTRTSESYDHLWGETGNLHAPAARPGYVQRWVRYHIGGVDDVPNMEKRQRGAWVPRRADTVTDNQFARAKTDDGVIKVRGLMLMERPIAAAQSQARFNRRMLDAQLARVDADLADSSYVQHGMRPFVTKETQTAVEVGSGRAMPEPAKD